MYGEGFFSTQLETVEVILRSANLFEERQLRPDKSQGASNFRKLSYDELYAKCIRDFVYDFRLTDQSLILFVRNGKDDHDGSISFSYYESPKKLITYEDFVAEVASLDNKSESFDEDLSFWGNDLRSDFEQYIESTDLKEVVTPIRYDYMARDYRCNVHPASHIHFGFNSHIRVGTRNIITPICFLLFIIRQRYPEEWVRLTTHKNFGIWSKEIRFNLNKVISDYWTLGDENELYFS